MKTIMAFILSIITSITVLFSGYNPYKMPDYEKKDEPHSWTAVSSGDENSIADEIGDESPEMSAQTWICNEISLESSKEYDDYFTECEIDMILEGCGRQYRIPGFWDGGKTYKVRFTCPAAGEWVYKTICSDTANEGLNGITGRVVCSEYSGEDEIYKRGFVTTRYGEKYFTYDDGTPFFYLGDTHWSLFAEPLDVLQQILDKRISQNYTVIQSQAIKVYGHDDNAMAVQLDLTDGYGEDDMEEFAGYDATFRTVAENGLVHANAGLFGVDAMSRCIENNGGYSDKILGYNTHNSDAEPTPYYELSNEAKIYLEKISRLWCARYSAYPVLWTLAQEVDNDFFYGKENHPDWGVENSPYLLVAEYMDKYDAYDHPLTGHQESAGWVGYLGNKKDGNDPSAFNDCEAHTWFGVQYNPVKNKSNTDYRKEKDYWTSPKPAINYEGCYDMFWTKTFGARLQGWAAYLSGMYGYGWGHTGTWYYHTISSQQTYSTDVDFVSAEEQKATTWREALNAESAEQMGYMAEFFSDMEWWKLIPGFGSKLEFSPDKGVYAHVAGTEDRNTLVIYVYSFSDSSLASTINTTEEAGYKTGTVKGLEPGGEYRFRWFSPVTGEYSEEGTFTASILGTYKIGNKTMNGKDVNTDMVFYIYR